MKSALLSLVGLFPEPFRDQFGSSIAEQIDAEYDAARARGLWELVAFTIATTADLVVSALAEHWRPTWVVHAGSTGDKGMRATLEEWGRDLRLAGRGLRRSPGFTAVAIGTLGLAIGANAGMFSVVHAVLLNPLPYGAPERLVSISSIAPGSQVQGEFGVSPEFLLAFKADSRLLEDAALFATGTSTLRVKDRVERVPMAWPSNSLFPTLGVRPLLGRLPTDADGDEVAVISYKMWTEWFGQDSSALGQSHFMSDRNRQIVGIMGPDFRFPSDQTLLWITSPIRAEGMVPGRFFNNMVARKKPGVTDDALVTELTSIGKRLPERFGGSANYARIMERYRAQAIPISERFFGNVERPLWVLLGSVGIVLLIACANVANLFMVRTEGRHRELAVRRALGAARGTLIRLQMSESVAVAIAAGVLAIGLAWLALPTFLRAAPAGIPRLSDASLGGWTLVFTFGLAVASAIVCGLVPAIRASAPDLMRLRDGGRGATGRRHWGRDGLVVAQTALALVLLIGSGLLMRSYDKLNSVDAGYDTKDIFTFQFAPQQPALTDGQVWARFHYAFMERIKALPGVQTVGIVENMPLDEGTGNVRFLSDDMGDDAEAGVRLSYTFTAGDYFTVMGIDVVAGRGFTQDDQFSMAPQVVISRSVANMLWPGKSAVGRRLRQDFISPDGTAPPPPWYTVVGVVEDVKQLDYRAASQALVYYPIVGTSPTAYRLTSPAYAIKTPRAEVIASDIRRLVAEVAPEAPMYRAFTMDFLAKRSMTQLSFTMLTLGIASALALILGAVGLYGVLSYVVAERTKEIGVRMALGAEARQVLRMVVGQGARVVGVGVAIGIGVAYLSTKALGSLLFGVAALDWPTFAVMSASMIAVGLFASYMPARRASNVDPVESLRGD